MLSDDLIKGARAAAAYLGPSFSERNIYHLTERGLLPVIRLAGGRTLYYRKSDLDRTFTVDQAAVA